MKEIGIAALAIIAATVCFLALAYVNGKDIIPTLISFGSRVIILIIITTGGTYLALRNYKSADFQIKTRSPEAKKQL